MSLKFSVSSAVGSSISSSKERSFHYPSSTRLLLHGFKGLNLYRFYSKFTLEMIDPCSRVDCRIPMMSDMLQTTASYLSQ